MKLTIGICTRNRCSSLSRTLASLHVLNVPTGTELEVLVVDNASTDATDSTIARWTRDLPLRRLHEPVPGKSHALNRLVNAASGRYILFTDDDVKVEPDWLAEMVGAFERHPEAHFFGGAIEAEFLGHVPAWLAEGLSSVTTAYAILRPVAEVPIELGSTPFGANLAIRTETHQCFHYEARLGPQPGSDIRGKECHLIQALLKAGFTGWWVPGARVQHQIPPDRQTVRYLRGYYAGCGEANVVSGRVEREGVTFFGRPLWLWRQLVEQELRFQLVRWRRPPTAWLEQLKKASSFRGMFRAWQRSSVEQPEPART